MADVRTSGVAQLSLWTFRRWTWSIMILAIPCCATGITKCHAQKTSIDRETTDLAQVDERIIAGTSYHLRLAFEDTFANLDNWLIESSGIVATRDNQLVWKCESQNDAAGTIWCREPFKGPTVVEYDVEDVTGARNLNGMFYATNPPDGVLETTATRTGVYKEYHAFPNYIITYLTPRDENDKHQFSSSTWRVRFRKNPGFQLLTETTFETNQKPHRAQHTTYVFEADGTMRLIVDGQLLHEFRDEDSPYRSGYHGLRTWRTSAKYSNFKVYSIKTSLADRGACSATQVEQAE